MNRFGRKGEEPSADSMAAWEQQARAAFAEYGYGSGNPELVRNIGSLAATAGIVLGRILQNWRGRRQAEAFAMPDVKVVIRPAEPGDDPTETTVVTGTIESE